jgi:hypothetical protein
MYTLIILSIAFPREKESLIPLAFVLKFKFYFWSARTPILTAQII